jgi:hypothetical protein
MNGKDLALPPSVRKLLDGSDLAAKIGISLQLCVSVPGGVPGVALLSVGEVVCVDADKLMVLLHAGSRTAAALSEQSRALLLVVGDERLYRIEVMAERLGTHSMSPEYAIFRCSIRAVSEDRVSYARVLGGITFQLVDPDAVVARWRQQIAQLTATGA